MSNRKRRRWPRAVALGSGIVLFGFVALVGPWPIDTSNLLASREGKKAITAASSLGEELRIESGTAERLQVGFARRELEFSGLSIPLAGYGSRDGAAAEGSREPLYASCFALETSTARVVIVCADLLLIPREVAGEVRARLRTDDGNRAPPEIIFTATHTHSGPGGWGRSFLARSVAGEFNEEIPGLLADAIVDAARAAAGKARPGSWAWVSESAPDLVRNRTVEGGPLDPSVESLLFRREGDPGIALLTIFGAHATTLSPTVMEFSGDYPAAFCRAVEDDPRVGFAAFAAGAVGSQAPNGEGSEFTRARSMGTRLAEKVLSDLPRAEFSDRVELRAATTPLILPDLQVRIADDLRTSSFLASRLHGNATTLAGLRMDRHLWIGVPFELSGMIAGPLRRRAERFGLDLHLTCFSGDYLGYILPDELYADHGLYEAQMNFLGPTGGSFVEAAIERVIRSAARDRDR